MPRLGSFRYPYNWHAFADEFWYADYDSVGILLTAAQLYQYVYQIIKASAGAYGQKWVYAAPGTYVLGILGIMASNCGILSWYLDDVLISEGQDWYSAVSVVNVLYPMRLEVPDGGRHLLRFVVTGKNDSSSGYRFQFTKVLLYVSGEG